MPGIQTYFRHILHYYEGAFDFTAPYTQGNARFDCLAAMHAHEDQYVRLVGTTLWASDKHEFTVFRLFPTAPPTLAQLVADTAFLADYMEPQLVRGGEALPPEDHHQTDLTIVWITAKTPDESVLRAIKKYRFSKMYRFYFRGGCEGRILLADLETGKITANGAAQHLTKPYRQALKTLAGVAYTNQDTNEG